MHFDELIFWEYFTFTVYSETQKQPKLRLISTYFVYNDMASLIQLNSLQTMQNKTIIVNKQLYFERYSRRCTPTFFIFPGFSTAIT